MAAYPSPSRLAIFVTDPDTGVPVPRLPLFAEVIVPRTTPTPRPDQRWIEAFGEAFSAVDPQAADPTRAAVRSAVELAIAYEIARSSEQALLADHHRGVEFVVDILKGMLDAAAAADFADVPADRLLALARAAARASGERMQLELNPPSSGSVLWSDPLGVLTTDHAGYASFDLRRLRPDVQEALAGAIDARRRDAETSVVVRVQAYGSDHDWDVLAQGRFAMDAVVGRFEASWHTLPPALQNMGMRALQDPSLTDWRLSPGSFAASPQSLLGEDGTEELLPANLALQEFVLRQVVRLSGTQGANLPADAYAAYVDDYRVTWSALGHSLGEIQYSLPLAPGETVRLAVIDWSRTDTASRSEDTVFDESLLHETHRDRTISETVKAALQEYQHGSSFMGGAAHSAGGSGSGSIGVFGVGAAVGDTWSMGGSTATSEGSRDLAAENVQRLGDGFSQASSAMRELTSTVVVQSQQNEKQTIQTRTFSNYNHAHTMTVLYYEVLRHYRVSVEWIRRRRAVLLRGTKIAATITAAEVTARRFIIEPRLLDPSLANAFDATARRALGEAKLARAITAWDASAVTDDPGLKVFVGLVAQFTTTDDDTTEPVFLSVRLKNGNAFELQFDDAGDEGTSPEYEKPLPVPVLWRDLQSVTVLLKDVNSGSDWTVTNVLVTMKTGAGERIGVVAWTGSQTLDDDGGTLGPLATNAPPAATVTHPTAKPVRSDFVSAEDDLAADGLVVHIQKNAFYYDRLFALTTHVDQVATGFETLPWPGGHAIDHVVPTPLETFGSYVAYPLADQGALSDDIRIAELVAALGGNDPARRAWATDQLASLDEEQRAEVVTRVALASGRSERLITMPTRGVFAEGKLGHGNVAEEIDNTRFWKWDEHPIPILAPEIAAVTPVTPTPTTTPTTPTAFPQSLVNVVAPSAAPDPVGLSAALQLLGTSNIFRDMSGQALTEDLLKKLSDNTISIAEAANRAREIQARSGGSAGGSGGSGGSGAGGASASGGSPSTGLGAPRVSPGDRPSTTTQDLKDLQHVLGSAQSKDLISPDDARQTYTNAVKGAYDPDFVLTGNTSKANPGAATSGRPAVVAANDAQLAQAANVEFFDAKDIDDYFTDVTGQSFAGWLSANLSGRGSWSSMSMSVDADTLRRFTDTWNAFPAILGTDRGFGPSITLPEFATLMAKFLHETGSALKFQGAEGVGGYGHAGLSYPFDSFVISRPGETPFTKGSYNLGNGNKTAFDCFHDPIYLAAFGSLAPTAQATRDLPAWKGSVWPAAVPTDVSGAGTAFLREADFYKFRGRGAIQSTGRGAYLPIVAFVRAYTGTDAAVTAVKDDWDARAAAIVAGGVPVTTDADYATMSTNADWDALFASVTIQAAAIKGHNDLAGKHYLPMSNSAAVLRGTARGSAYFVAVAIAGNNPAYGNDVRARMMEFIGTLWNTPMPTVAAPAGTVTL